MITPRTSRLWHCLIVVSVTSAVWLSGWLDAPSASAHAAYASSSPEFGEVLAESPTTIQIRFSQELFRRDGANKIALWHVDSESAIPLGALTIRNEDRREMSVEVADQLAAGRYLVSWSNLSAEDGDEDMGSYPFYVEREPSAAELDEDREMASELLIAYPGDEPVSEADDETTPLAPTVVRTDRGDTATLGVGPILWLAVGLVAALGLVGAMGYSVGARRQELDRER